MSLKWMAIAMASFGLACAGQPADVKTSPVALEQEPKQEEKEAPPKEVKEASLYEQLGGRDAIEAVVTEFTKNVAADERINARFGLADLDLLHERLVTFFCEATGGPCRYEGRDMKSAHAGMGVTTAQFGALAEALVDSMTTCGVPEAKQAMVIQKIAPLQADIVEVE